MGVFDSFKPVNIHEKDASVVKDAEIGNGGESPKDEGELLKRRLKGRHMQMIAIGGSIGAGLFIGSGGALRTGGPASLIIDFSIIGLMLLFTVNALGELAVMYPVAGAFYTYSVRFIDPAWGFAMGWNYALNWLVVLPFELTAATATISFWTDKVDVSVWVTIFLLMVIVINIFGVKGYGEVEFVLGCIKVAAVIMFILLGIIIDVGGVPTDDRGYIGGRYWSDPGAFRNGFKGFLSVFVTASFAFGGTELVGLAAAEAENPRKSLPKATKQVLWRISLFYIISLTILGLIVPSDTKELSDASVHATQFSPFVIAMKLAGIKVMPHIFNAVITLSVMSVANSCSYASTRTLQALALHKMAPHWLKYVDRQGRPVMALLVQLAFGFLAYINKAPNGMEIFYWLLALSGLANFFTWGSICLAHIRFRAAWKHQGRHPDELPFKSGFGVWGSYIGLILNVFCLIAQFYMALYPIGGPNLDAKNFFMNYLAGPVVILFWVGYKVWKRRWTMYVPIAEIDVDVGRRQVDMGTVLEEERAERATWGTGKRIYNFFC